MSQKGKVVAEIQARMGASRLPGKVLKFIVGKPMLELLIERVKRAKLVDEIIIATSENSNDDVIEDLAKKLNVSCFRGSEQDVLSRVVKAVESIKGEIVVQLWGDASLIDPEIIDNAIKYYLEMDVDAVATFRDKTYPWGMALFVFPFKIIQNLDKVTEDPVEREHVSNHIYENPGKFNVVDLPCPKELCYPELRLVVDEQKDFELVSKVFEYFYPENPNFTTKDIIEYLNKNPEIKSLNQNVQQTVLRKDS